MSSTPVAKSELITQVNDAFTPLEQLWNQSENGEREIQGVDPSQKERVYQGIHKAYDAMRELRRTLEISG